MCLRLGNGTILWRIIPLSILWSIWKERDDQIFNREESNREDLLTIVLLRIAKRASARKKFSNTKIDHIMQNFRVCLKMEVAKKKRKVSWLSPCTVFKFNVDGISR